MSVNVGNRGPSKMKVFMAANDLAVYTIKICTNDRIFVPKYQNAITNDIMQTAKDIFIDAWEANDIRVKKKEDWDERKHLQNKSIRNCRNLLALMQIAQRLFHLKAKRIEYWGAQTKQVKDLLSAWRDSDQKRYGDIYA